MRHPLSCICPLRMFDWVSLRLSSYWREWSTRAIIFTCINNLTVHQIRINRVSNDMAFFAVLTDETLIPPSMIGSLWHRSCCYVTILLWQSLLVLHSRLISTNSRGKVCDQLFWSGEMDSRSNIRRLISPGFLNELIYLQRWLQFRYETHPDIRKNLNEWKNAGASPSVLGLGFT
jgi:hypothetical protein